MILITVVDDRMGMCFNRRRLSRDRVLSDKILTLTNGKVLWMSSYSEKLFGSVKHSQINIDDDCLREAAADKYCVTTNHQSSTARFFLLIFVKEIETYGKRNRHLLVLYVFFVLINA